MTTKGELPKLFNYDPKTDRIVSFAGSVGLVFDHTGGSDAVAVATQMLFPKTKKPADRMLCTFLSPADAMHLAMTVLQHAQKRGWTLPEGIYEHVEIRHGPGSKLN